MDRTRKTFDAVKMVRKIRARHHEQFKDKPIEDRLEYYRRKAQDFHEHSTRSQEDEMDS